MGKSHMELKDQLDLLVARGMIVSDKTACLHALGTIGYYRLSAYWHPLRRRRLSSSGQRLVEDRFVDGADFDKVLELYEFDQNLRKVTFEQIERLEVALRFHVGHTLGRTDPNAHRNPDFFEPDFVLKKTFSNSAGSYEQSDHDRLLYNIEREMRRSSDDFVAHHKAKYAGEMPIWAATEVMSLHHILELLRGLRTKHLNEVAEGFGLFDNSGVGAGGALRNWVESILELRNICAHHGRVWNRVFAKPLRLNHLRVFPETRHVRDLQIQHREEVDNPAHKSTKRIYGVLLVMSVLNDRLGLNENWQADLRTLLLARPEVAGLRQMGFPDEWGIQTVWS
jgi:abortive infection bacteriophage resistance protein